MFKQISNLMGMMGQMKEMGSKMGELTEELRSKRVTGASGGGMVEVEMNGANEVIDIRIDDVVMADKEMLLDLLPSAINQAIVKAKELHMESMKSLAGGMDLPGLDEAMAQITGGTKS